MKKISDASINWSVFLNIAPMNNCKIILNVHFSQEKNHFKATYFILVLFTYTIKRIFDQQQQINTNPILSDELQNW